MRVSEKMLFDSTTRHLRLNADALLKVQDRVSSGKRVSRPSDDPVSAARILGYGRAVDQVDQYLRNMNESEQFLSVSESALSGVEERIHRASELAVDMANASKHPEDRKIAASEVKQIFEQLTAVANTVHNGQTIFAGNKITTAPFDFEKQWQGQYVGTTLQSEAFPITIDNSNDTLNVTVDGTTIQVTLDSGHYSREDLVVQIQEKVGGALPTTSSVVVEFKPDDVAVPDTGSFFITSDTVKGRSSVVFKKVVQPVSDPNAPAVLPLGDARQALGLVDGKSQLSGEAYLGDAGEMLVLVESGVALAKNIPGSRAFNGGAVGGVDIFSGLLNLQTALETSNVVGIQTAITDMEKATEQISNERAFIGIRLARLEDTRIRLEDFKTVTIASKSEEEDIDLTSAISELIQRQNALSASQSAMARILQQPTLLSFLR